MQENFTPSHDLSVSLTGEMLISTPHSLDPRFEKAVIYLCEHDTYGAMGLMVNKHFGNLTLSGLLEQLLMFDAEPENDSPLHFGGPVESGRGFVLHSDDFRHPGTLFLSNQICLTANLEILQAIVSGEGPQNYLLAMGYVGWGPGQLDKELHGVQWILAKADPLLLFDVSVDNKWAYSLDSLGISPERFSEEFGNA